MIRTTLLLCVPALLQGCASLYEEDMEDCYDGVSIALWIDPSMTEAEAAEAAAEHAVLYIFDDEGRFLERRETSVGNTEHFSHRSAGPLSVVGWINKHESFDITPFDASVRREHGLVTLATDAGSRADDSSCLFPTDLFYGEAGLVNSSTSFDVEHIDVYASRLTGQATVTVRGLQEYTGIYDDDFYIVTNQTAGAVDFFGNHLAHTASHICFGEFDPAGDFATSLFNLMPSADDVPVNIQIWHRTAGLIYETTLNQENGEEIYIVPDRTTNILIEFISDVSISISVEQTLWGVSFPWKTFN